MVHDSTADRLRVQAGPIVVYGATGFTGGLIARELKRLGAEFLIAGRDERKDVLGVVLSGHGPRAPIGMTCTPSSLT